MEYLSGVLSAEDIRFTDMFKRGDCINIWVNEGEFLMMQLEHVRMRQQLAKPAVETNTTRDAERYQWLCEFHEWGEEIDAAINCGSKFSIDEAIDKAIEAAK